MLEISYITMLLFLYKVIIYGRKKLSLTNCIVVTSPPIIYYLIDIRIKNTFSVGHNNEKGFGDLHG